MLKPGRRLAVLAMLALATAACGDDDDGGTEPTDITGTYTLRTIDGDALPFTLFTAAQNAGTKREVTSGSVTLRADGTYSDRFDFRDTNQTGDETDQFDATDGTWARTGNTITFSASTGLPQEPAILRNGALIFEVETSEHPAPLEFRLTK